jgi:hypothetical protein
VSTDLGQKTEQQPATRADLARQLLARVDRLAPRLNDVLLAVEIQLLKRELARGHPILSARPEDNNFLSVVTLVGRIWDIHGFSGEGIKEKKRGRSSM